MSKRSYFVAGNWKMNLLQDEARALVRGITPAMSDLGAVRVGVAPTFTSLAAASDLIGESGLLLGAQNCHEKASGAYTGEISAPMLRDAGCDFVILGHSERRQYFGETDATVNNKLHAAIGAALHAIVCVGETEAEREAGKTAAVIETQVRGCLAGLKADVAVAHLTIAYEPVWAIGTGKTATPEMAQEVHGQIRMLLAAQFDAAVASAIAIQYGGSMKPDNAAELLAQPDIDGGLIGGAALKADSFLKICQAAANAAKR
jgi:triosephosphate isomerase